MKELGKRIWNEPAVAIGLLVTLILLVINIVDDNTWDAQSIIAIAAPLASALGIRAFVTPTASIDTKPPVIVQSSTVTDPERQKGF